MLEGMLKNSVHKFLPIAPDDGGERRNCSGMRATQEELSSSLFRAMLSVGKNSMEEKLYEIQHT